MTMVDGHGRDAAERHQRLDEDVAPSRPRHAASPRRRAMPLRAIDETVRHNKSGSYTLLMMRALTSLRAAASGETIGW